MTEINYRGKSASSWSFSTPDLESCVCQTLNITVDWITYSIAEKLSTFGLFAMRALAKLKYEPI
jgi:hypothetical protein